MITFSLVIKICKLNRAAVIPSSVLVSGPVLAIFDGIIAIGKTCILYKYQFCC